ncbi:MAG: class I SAM-dependent methyltransferase [Planctomycetales bacterium]|nr:class I SAM-dependent methyltransferase [Planctomycetales bacterium]
MLRTIKKWSRRLRGKRTVAMPSGPAIPPDLSAENVEIFQSVNHATMTSPERVSALCDAVRYVVSQGIPGDLVECGVWRGGSSMASALTLIEQGDMGRELWLYDTFEGMSEPTEDDRDFLGQSAAAQLELQDPNDPKSVWCVSQLDEVRGNMRRTGYPADQVHFVVGKVEETIPAQVPETIALLRLDTDWYESTRHELEHLMPRLSPGGVLIIDDYGHWQGCRRAVDEYLSEHGLHLLLHRIDYTGRMAIVGAPGVRRAA